MIPQVKCINCKNLRLDGWCEKIADSPHDDLDRRCDFFQTATNADSIRRMNDDELAEFQSVVSPMYAQMRINAIENDRLKRLRDSLLPKLMSGEIDVSGIQL